MSSHIEACKKKIGVEIQKKDPIDFSYFYKDSEYAIRFFPAFMQFEKSVPEKCEKFAKKSIFFKKIACISKTIQDIFKNSTPIAFFCNFTYNIQISSKSVHK